MKPLLSLLLVLFSVLSLKAGKDDSLIVNYYENAPFAFKEGQHMKGIEMDILQEYLLWLKSKKNIDIVVRYKGFSDFESFLNSTKNGQKNSMGLGTLTISQERRKEMDFTDPVLKNVAFCITNGNAPDLRVKSKEEMIKVFGPMTGITIANSSLHSYLLEMKKNSVPDLKINFQSSPSRILDEISRNVLQFGFVDAVSFWIYLKQNPGRFLKMQKALNQSREELGFAMPKGSPHAALFNEFFSGEKGFKYSKNYRAILEKYLGTYMTQNMAIY